MQGMNEAGHDSLLSCLSILRRENEGNAEMPTAVHLSSKLSSIEYPDMLSALKKHNDTGTLFARFAGDSQNEYLQVLIEAVREEDRFSIFQIRNHFSETLVHKAIRGGNHCGVQLILKSLTSDQRLQLLMLLDTSNQTALDYVIEDNTINEDHRDVIFLHLNDEQKDKLVAKSEKYKRVASEDDMGRENVLVDVNQGDEATPTEPGIGTELTAFAVGESDALEQVGPGLAEMVQKLVDESSASLSEELNELREFKGYAEKKIASQRQELDELRDFKADAEKKFEDIYDKLAGCQFLQNGVPCNRQSSTSDDDDESTFSVPIDNSSTDSSLS